MKCQGGLRRADRRASLPVRGAWIEIVPTKHIFLAVIGRSPCGERGLKFHKLDCLPANVVSLPVRGAWIEIIY